MVCFECSSGDYRITMVLYVAMAKSGSISTNNSQTWIYEIHDGVITKISGGNPSTGFSVESSGYMSAYATITSISIEAI